MTSSSRHRQCLTTIAGTVILLGSAAVAMWTLPAAADVAIAAVSALVWMVALDRQRNRSGSA